MKKLSNIDESVWSDIHKRSNGKAVRKEDEMYAIDMGGDILWSPENFTYEGKELFTFDEAIKLIKDSEWRLPTKKELHIFDWCNSRHDSKYIYLYNDDGGEISFKKCGTIDHLGSRYGHHDEFYGWTSEPFQNPDLIHIYVIDESKISFTEYDKDFYEDYEFDDLWTLPRNNKCCIRLVRDK